MAGPVGPDGHHPESGLDPGSYTIPPYINALIFRDQVRSFIHLIKLKLSRKI